MAGFTIRPLSPDTGDVPEGKKISPSFLYNLTRDVYEQAGFTYERPKGKGNCVMVRIVEGQ